MVDNNSNCNTKKLLSNALKNIMAKKPLEKITIKEIVEEVSEDLDIDNRYKDFVAHYYTVSLVGMVIHWIQSGMSEEPETIAKFIEITVEGTMRNALERFGKLWN